MLEVAEELTMNGTNKTLITVADGQSVKEGDTLILKLNANDFK